MAAWVNKCSEKCQFIIPLISCKQSGTYRRCRVLPLHTPRAKDTFQAGEGIWECGTFHLLGISCINPSLRWLPSKSRQYIWYLCRWGKPALKYSRLSWTFSAFSMSWFTLQCEVHYTHFLCSRQAKICVWEYFLCHHGHRKTWLSVHIYIFVTR